MSAKPRFFGKPAEFRTWLARHHRTADELLVGFHRKATGRPSLTWPQSVDEALCFGWIDGVRRRIDETCYTIRFTPRRPGSNWSAINIRRVAELTRLGFMQAAGHEAFGKRSEAKSGIYAYEQRHKASFTISQQKQFRASPKAWTFFQAQPASYRQIMTWWIAMAKRDETKQKRLEKLIDFSSRKRRIL